MSMHRRTRTDKAVPDQSAGDDWHRVCISSPDQADCVIGQLLAAMAAVGYATEEVDRLRRALVESMHDTLVAGIDFGYRVNAERALVSIEVSSSRTDFQSVFELGVLLKGFDLKWIRYRRRGRRLLSWEYHVVH